MSIALIIHEYDKGFSYYLQIHLSSMPFERKFHTYEYSQDKLALEMEWCGVTIKSAPSLTFLNVPD